MCRVSVLASGSGSNFQMILDRASEDERIRPVLLIANRLGIGAIERATAAAVESTALSRTVREGAESESGFLLQELRRVRTDLVVLAGYLRLVPVEVVREYRGRMINIHPALLPSFGGKGMYGPRVHRAVLAAGARVTGVTVHFVDDSYDRGPIITQWPVPVLEGDDEETLAARVLRVEHRLLPTVVGALARGLVQLEEDGTVAWREDWFEGERFEIRPDGSPRVSGEHET